MVPWRRLAPRIARWGKSVLQEKKNLPPERPDALDALEASDTTCLTRTQFAMPPCIWTQLATTPCVRTQLAIASAYRTERIRAFSFWTQPCQGIFLLDAAMSAHFPSGRSRVRAFSFWTQLCQGIFLLDAAMSGHFPSERCRVRANGIWMMHVMAPRSRWLSRHRTSQQILLSHSQTCSRF